MDMAPVSPGSLHLRFYELWIKYVVFTEKLLFGEKQPSVFLTTLP